MTVTSYIKTSYKGLKYPYGFNGMEKDDEVKGANNSLDFGARIYDNRIGRWLARDPLEIKYPMLSTYCFVANSPLIFVDPDGRDIVGVKKLIRDKATGKVEKIVFEEDVSDELKVSVQNALMNLLNNTENGSETIDMLMEEGTSYFLNDLDVLERNNSEFVGDNLYMEIGSLVVDIKFRSSEVFKDQKIDINYEVEGDDVEYNEEAGVTESSSGVLVPQIKITDYTAGEILQGMIKYSKAINLGVTSEKQEDVINTGKIYGSEELDETNYSLFIEMVKFYIKNQSSNSSNLGSDEENENTDDSDGN